MLGEDVHASYREHFRHRYGGNAPGWDHISPAERELWGAVELDQLRAAARRLFAREDDVLPDGPAGELVKLAEAVAEAVEREGRRLAERVRDGELLRCQIEAAATATGDGEPAYALRLLDVWGITA